MKEKKMRRLVVLVRRSDRKKEDLERQNGGRKGRSYI